MGRISWAGAEMHGSHLWGNEGLGGTLSNTAHRLVPEKMHAVGVKAPHDLRLTPVGSLPSRGCR